MARSSKGTVSIEALQGRLRLRLPRHLYEGKQKYLTLGLSDTPHHRAIAQAKAKQIEADITLERFDYSLDRYRTAQESPVKQRTVEATLTELWRRYVAYKTPISSPKTVLDCYAPIGRHFDKAPQRLDQSLEIRAYLLEVTTEAMARRCLMHLSAACKWGIKHGIVGSNPFEGMYLELSKPRYQLEHQANPFTEEERDRIIEAFERHNEGRKGISYCWYANFVRFLFLTGCRPSEAIGLQWKHISDDCSRITFTSAIVRAGGKALARDTTKTKRRRVFPCSPSLVSMLLEMRAVSSVDLVFPSRSGSAINYNDFARRAWKTVTTSVGLCEKHGMVTTPYNCRDTFITLQAAKGVSSDAIAKWVGNTPSVIKRHYLGDLEMQNLKPIE